MRIRIAVAVAVVALPVMAGAAAASDHRVGPPRVPPAPPIAEEPAFLTISPDGPGYRTTINDEGLPADKTKTTPKH